MERIIEVEGQKVRIQDYHERAFEYTDHNGKTVIFDTLGLHDPVLHKKLGFTTIQSVLKWWVANREFLLERAEDAGISRNYVIDKTMHYFDIFDSLLIVHGGVEELKPMLAGHLRSPSLKYDFNRSPLSSRMILFEQDNEQEGETIYCLLTVSFLGRCYLEPRDRTSTSLDEWEQHYNYSFKMNPTEFNWWRTVKNESSVMFGMELEICTKLTTVEIQKIVREVEPKQEPFFIFKQDSSISGKFDNRLELVTVPCTPRYLRKNWKIFFQKLERLCRNKGLEVGDVVDTSKNLSNGLHIHVSKDSFFDRLHYKKFLTAWNQWNKTVVNLFNIVAERPTDYTKNSYCKINYNYDGKVLARRLKGLHCDDRMSVAHDQSGQTIEVRVYQGIFDLKHIMQCISFTEAMFEFCLSIGFSEFDAKFVRSMSKFVRTERKYASLYEVFTKAISK